MDAVKILSFVSFGAWSFIIIWLLLNGFFTFSLGGFFEMGQASLTMSFFRWHPWLYLFLVPAVGMRLWSEGLISWVNRWLSCSFKKTQR